MTEITTRDPEDMEHSQLLAEWREIQERVESGTLDSEEYDSLLDRASDLWTEMKSRTDADAPECPRDDCGGQRWGQTFGDPKTCIECGRELGEQHADLIERIDDYWRAVKSPPDEDAEPATA